MDLHDLAKQLAPYLAKELTKIPTYWGDSDENLRIQIGANVSLVNTFFNPVSGNIIIEDDVIFGHNVCVLTGSHDIDKTVPERNQYPDKGNDIIIKKGAWIASNVTLIGPCIIGENSVVGACSMIFKCDVPSNQLWAGTPAKFIRTLG